MLFLFSLPSLSLQESMFQLKYITAQTLVSFIPCTMGTNHTPNVSYGLGIYWPQLPPQPRETGKKCPLYEK